jgi:hypothetical protein
VEAVSKIFATSQRSNTTTYREHGVHHLEIPQTSHNSIRKVGFLGDDDELVIMAPVQGCLIRWDSIEDRPTAVIEAAVWWRARLDGTHG